MSLVLLVDRVIDTIVLAAGKLLEILFFHAAGSLRFFSFSIMSTST
jgi:hypothetical protein